MCFNEKKILLTISIVVFAWTQLPAQNALREQVAIVRPSYHESAVAFLTDFEKSLRKDGYTQAAEILKASLRESFGSGFIYVDTSNNRAYIITNKHVVAHAQWVDIEFLAADRTLVKYDRCPVIAVDEKYDIAAVELPHNAIKNNGMSLYTKPVVDGEEVIAAGYPGLNNKPAWQMTKGAVSNAVLSIPDISGKDITVIQHTADVDPGSSGGPLLVKNPTTNQFEVVGINTWKITGEGNVRLNLAIPASAISDFIRRDVMHSTTTTTDELKLRTSDFIQAGKTDYRKLLPFISYTYMSNLTADGFWELLNNVSDSRRKMVYDLFTQGQAIDAIRVTLADAMCRLLINKNTSVGDVNNFTSVSEPVTVKLKYGLENASSTWIAEQGHWRITDFSPLKINKYGKKGVDDAFGYRHGIRAGVGIPFSEIEKVYATLSYSKTIVIAKQDTLIFFRNGRLT
ncbi:S1C family serine protease [Petrimonas sp.]|uniref:S1C family serine protease n=1 Tax=Petrimonas sp. TaxID=2023866 RepID=UPI003F50DD12